MTPITIKRLPLIIGLLLAAAALNACASLQPQTAVEEEVNVVEASGFLEAEEISIVSQVDGRVVEVLADEGDTVTAGQEIVRLDDRVLRAERAQAEAAVKVAEANLLKLKAGASAEELAAAEAALDEVQAQIDAAKRTSGAAWGEASNPQSIEVQIASAEMELDLAQRQLELLQIELDKAEQKLNWLKEEDEADDTAIEFQGYTIEILKANIRAAEARIEGAKKKLELLKQQRDRPVGAIARARSAQARIGIYEAQLMIAQAQLDLLENGPRPQEIAIAEAQVRLAEAQLAFLDAQLEQLILVAPIGGVVTTRAIQIGETAKAGTPLLTITDLSQIKLVVYVPEDQIGLVRLGTKVRVNVDAFPGDTFRGEITFIAQEHEFTPRNVQTEEERVDLVFAVEITLDNADGSLKPGMPADVLIGGGD